MPTWFDGNFQEGFQNGTLFLGDRAISWNGLSEASFSDESETKTDKSDQLFANFNRTMEFSAEIEVESVLLSDWFSRELTRMNKAYRRRKRYCARVKERLRRAILKGEKTIRIGHPRWIAWREKSVVDHA